MGERMIYRIPTTVRNLEFKSRIVRTRMGKDGEIITDRENLGWYVHFDSSYESLCVSKELKNKPTNLEPGTKVDILIVPKHEK